MKSRRTLAVSQRAERGIRVGRSSHDLQGHGEGARQLQHSEVAREAGLQRTSIYRAFGNERLPNFSTVVGVLTAMGLEIRVVPRRRRKQSPTF
ncbi:helix-turn-helix domain-containing transcriptional regulator [Bradyrhizobium sp. LM2.3]